MKKELFYGIEMYELSSVTKKQFIKENKGIKNDTLSYKYSWDIYQFKDKRVLIDFNKYAFLFNNLSDLLNYLKITSEMAYREAQSDLKFESDFIDKVPVLINDFEAKYHSKIDFSKTDNINILDSIIVEDNNREKNVQAYKTNIIAIVGEFIKWRLKKGTWSFLKENEKIILPIIVDENFKIYNPVRIVESFFSQIRNIDQRSFKNYVEEELAQYNINGDKL